MPCPTSRGAPEIRPVPGQFNWEALVSTLSHAGNQLYRRHASGHIDDHFRSILALARRLARYDLVLEEDNVVITGAFIQHGITAPGLYEGRFEGIGNVSVEFV